MTSTKRTADAALPTASRPQPAPSARPREKLGRPRITHLHYHARLPLSLRPVGLPNTAKSGNRVGSHLKGHSYRNAALQALLNTPMFVNFLRDHRRRVVELKKGKCAVKGPCLACAMVGLVAHYWDPDRVASHANISLVLSQLWDVCKSTFWLQKSPSQHRIGPSDEYDEFYSDSFLLQLLAEMQRQLEISPSEYQTFLRMFTIDTVHRWKCSLNNCDWSSAPVRWLQSLYLPIEVQKHTSTKTHTEIAHGIDCALNRQKVILQAGRDINGFPRCQKCGNVTRPQVDLVNLPEVLILVRNTDMLGPGQFPDIPLTTDQLYMQHFTERRNEARLKNGTQGPEKDYLLVAGTAERKANAARVESIAFVRGGPIDIDRQWFAISDEFVEGIPGLDQVDRLQRAWDGTGDPIREHVFPGLFIYARVDTAGFKESDLQLTTWNAGQDQSYRTPNAVDEAQRLRDSAGRSLTEIFVQNFGQGLLKFKVNLAPADPGPTDSVPFVLEMGYELNNCHWRLENRLIGRLLPEKDTTALTETPKELEPFRRYIKRQDGPATPQALSKAQLAKVGTTFAERFPGDVKLAVLPDNIEIIDVEGASEMDKKFGNTGVPVFDRTHPFNDIKRKHDAENGMEWEPEQRAGIGKPPKATRYEENARQNELKKAMRQASKESSYGIHDQDSKKKKNPNNNNTNKNHNNQRNHNDGTKRQSNSNGRGRNNSYQGGGKGGNKNNNTNHNNKGGNGRGRNRGDRQNNN